MRLGGVAIAQKISEHYQVRVEVVSLHDIHVLDRDFQAAGRQWKNPFECLHAKQMRQLEIHRRRRET